MPSIEVARAWKVRPSSPLSRDPTPLAQVRWVCDRPLLTVRDRQVPVLRARGGHGRRGQYWLQRGSDGHKLNRRASQSAVTTCLVGQRPEDAWQLEAGTHTARDL